MRLPPLVLRDGDRAVLERRIRQATVEARAAERARIVLLAAQGCSNVDISHVVGLHWNQVAVWRRCYEAFGLAGLEDGSRPGRPHVYGHDDVLLLVKTVRIAATITPSGERRRARASSSAGSSSESSGRSVTRTVSASTCAQLQPLR